MADGRHDVARTIPDPRPRGRPSLARTQAAGFSPVLRLRVPYSLVDDLEWLRAELSARNGRTLTLSQVVRDALADHVDAVRARRPHQPIGSCPHGGTPTDG